MVAGAGAELQQSASQPPQALPQQLALEGELDGEPEPGQSAQLLQQPVQLRGAESAHQRLGRVVFEQRRLTARQVAEPPVQRLRAAGTRHTRVTERASLFKGHYDLRLSRFYLLAK